MFQKCWTALTCSSKARKTNMWHIFPHKNIWGETSTACGISAKARLHSSPRYPKSLSWETSGPIPSWKVSGSAGNAEGGVWRAILWATCPIEIHLFQNPFAADIDKTLPSYQFELAELQNCDVLKDAFKPNGLIEFYAALPNETYPNIKRHAMKMSTLFGSTYICEQTFSFMKLMKTPKRSRLTDEHLHQYLRVAVTGMEPDIEHLTTQKQAHISQ